MCSPGCIELYLHCTGFVSNGEFNEFRGMGYTRPLSILKIRADMRAKYARMGKKKLMQMITVHCKFTRVIFA